MGRRKKRNVIAAILIWIFKAIWYVIKGIVLAIWWVLKTLWKAISSKKHSGNIVTTTATPVPADDSTPAAEQGRRKHTVSSTPLVTKNTIKGEFSQFKDRLAQASTIALIAGKRGSGKSALGFRILENVHAATARPCYALGVKASVLPTWITSVHSVDQVANKGMVLVDEGALTFSSRDSMSKKNKELGKLMAVARHKDLTLLLVTQNTGMIDKNVLNLCDTVILKEGSLLQQRMERDVMKDLYSKAADALGNIAKKDRIAHAYVVDNDFEGLVHASLPSFWNTSISKNQA